MPAFVFDTNLPKDKIPEGFMDEMTDILQKMLGKPKKFVSVQINPGQMMSFGGTEDLCGLGYLSCMGNKIGEEENKQYSAVLMEKLNRALNIPADKIYIIFRKLEGQNIGWNGKTFTS